jgi:hypothetical protein
MTVIVNRIFYVDTRNVPAIQILSYMTAFKASLEEQPQQEKNISHGLKQLGLWEDIFIPIHSDSRVEIHRIDMGSKLDSNGKA